MVYYLYTLMKKGTGSPKLTDSCTAVVYYGETITVAPLKRRPKYRGAILSTALVIYIVSARRYMVSQPPGVIQGEHTRPWAPRSHFTGYQPALGPPTNPGAPGTRPAGPGLPSGGDAADYG